MPDSENLQSRILQSIKTSDFEAYTDIPETMSEFLLVCAKNRVESKSAEEAITWVIKNRLMIESASKFHGPSIINKLFDRSSSTHNSKYVSLSALKSI
jgi:hypothetical protein